MLDPVRARAEADAAERRGSGTLWTAGPVAWEGVSAGAVAQAEVVPSVEEERDEAPGPAPRVAPMSRARACRLQEATAEVPTALLAAILARLQLVPRRDESSVPAWLAEAVGEPLTYDAASSHRIDVCARVDPALYRRLRAMKERLGLRTTAGAWEYVLRVGIAAADRCGRRLAR